MPWSSLLFRRVRPALLFGVALALLAWLFGWRLLSALPRWLADPANAPGALREAIALLVIAAFVLGVLVSRVSMWLALAPLSNVQETLRSIRRNPRARTRLRGDDEVGALGQTVDELADWVAAERASLLEDRNRRVAILESMAEGVLVTGPKRQGGLIVMANAALREMLLLDRPILGRTPMEVVRMAGLDEVLERAAQSAEGASGEIELTGLRAGRVLVHATPLRGAEGGESSGLVAVFNDVTELRRLEKVRRDFVANVSHELRTPIMAISSSTETLMAGALDDRAVAKDFVDIIARHALRLRQLVDDLLELSRIEAREWRLHLTAVAPRAAIAAAFEAVSIAAAKKSATLSNLAQEQPAWLRADPRALEQVLVNLLDNAIKYGGAKPVVEVRAWRDQARVQLEVRDYGPGIEPRHLPRIFERFYRVDAGRSRALGGTGLGLSIVRHLVEAMGGTIEVRSDVGSGCAFIVSLPAVEHPQEFVSNESSKSLLAAEVVAGASSGTAPSKQM